MFSKFSFALTGFAVTYSLQEVVEKHGSIGTSIIDVPIDPNTLIKLKHAFFFKTTKIGFKFVLKLCGIVAQYLLHFIVQRNVSIWFKTLLLKTFPNPNVGTY